MNKLVCVGNLTRDPEKRTVKTADGDTTVVSFTVAASNGYGDHKKTEFVKVHAWRNIGDICMKFLSKGSKVFVSGFPGVNAYVNKDGVAVGNLEMTLAEIEFLSAKPTDTHENPIADDEEDIEDLL